MYYMYQRISIKPVFDKYEHIIKYLNMYNFAALVMYSWIVYALIDKT